MLYSVMISRRRKPRMEIRTETRDGVVVLRPGGDLTLTHQDQIKQAFGDLASNAGAKIAVDMSAVGFIDSGGLGMLLWAKKQLQANGGELRLFGLTERVRDVFDITRLEKTLDVFATEADALEGF